MNLNRDEVAMVFFFVALVANSFTCFMLYFRIASLRDELRTRIHEEENTRMSKNWEFEARFSRLLDHLDLIEVKVNPDVRIERMEQRGQPGQ